MLDTPMTVVETARFLNDVKALLSQSEREELVTFVGANPEAGEIIPGDRRCQEDPLGIGWTRKARRRAGDLLLAQRTTTVIPTGGLREEREGKSQQG